MINPVLNFSLKLTGILVVTFALHTSILHYLQLPRFNNLIIESYVVNVLMAIIIYGSLFFLRKKYLDILGFIFMIGSFLKFGVYFVLFYPKFNIDGEVVRLEATSFLIPYLTCLTVETYYLIKLLNKD
ncbi:hypothetical protein SAMN06265371_102312 [Lutibacter agarilyticus]|uniref:Uncharacterized protein n=1 Tax=Lutibacter agarilyticus TaxID=1109740 RepID=A0A238W0N7_9FLAO|nr:hypothetical protein [Lutibacter agarilyticus]SNR40058.1 hypothetical protein SAMN06265371_102312 [Lutibacter agarilyticus]